MYIFILFVIYIAINKMLIYNPNFTLDEIRVYVSIINIMYNNFLGMFPNETTNHILRNKIKHINDSAISFFILFQSNRRGVMYQFYDILHTMYLYIDVYIKTKYINQFEKEDNDTNKAEKFDYSILFNDFDDRLGKNTRHLFTKLQN